MNGRALVTGAAGFIGSHVVDALILADWQVTAIDNFDLFYGKSTKLENIQQHNSSKNFRFFDLDICNLEQMKSVIKGEYDVVVHLAARPGVLASIDNISSYSEINIDGTLNVLEIARSLSINKFVFASTSSIYGINENLPWRENDFDVKPISPYAWTKLSGEKLGQVYSYLYGMSFFSLRFFTVYGPRQRPDLAISKFIRLISQNNLIPIYGDGSSSRDYTYVTDLVSGIVACLNFNGLGFEVFNIGSENSIRLLDLLTEIEKQTKRKLKIEWFPEQVGDVPATLSDISKARSLLGYNPQFNLESGISSYLDWLKR